MGSQIGVVSLIDGKSIENRSMRLLPMTNLALMAARQIDYREERLAWSSVTPVVVTVPLAIPGCLRRRKLIIRLRLVRAEIAC